MFDTGKIKLFNAVTDSQLNKANRSSRTRADKQGSIIDLQSDFPISKMKFNIDGDLIAAS